MAPPGTTGPDGFEVPASKGDGLPSDASNLDAGVLVVFPLLANVKTYWFKVLSSNLPDLVDKAVASEGGTEDAKTRGDAFSCVFLAHLTRMMEEPSAYGNLGPANLLELREEYLRKFHFADTYLSIK